ncbi:MAG TPA: hypothetical protein VK504_25565, partial [Vicinamibacterales bacterium]|nr:hypothetical protein [Vicinamibacterales bacterium]
MRTPTVLASAVLALAVSIPAWAQGKSQQHKKNPPAPPSRSDLAASAGVSMPVAAVAGPTPFAWIDDASLLEAGSVSIAMSVVRWQGSGISEVDAPVIDAAIGLAPRVHLTMTVPRVVGSEDPLGAAGGMGTSYFSAKIAAINDAKRGLKLSVAPTLEVLGSGVLQSMTEGERRAHFGLPVSVELDRGRARLYAGGGYFTRGVWFTGAGVGTRVNDKVFVSGGFSRSWRGRDVPDVPLSDRDRKEITGSGSYAVTPQISVYGALGRTIATLDENGAGTSLVGGVSFFV